MKKLLIIYLFLPIIFSNNAIAEKNMIRIAGSSIAYPYIITVAENFYRDNQDINIVVENPGTGIGFKLFCAKDQTYSPNLVVASRKMKDSELKLCKENNISNITEINFGFDAIVFVTSKENKISNLSRQEIFKTLAKYYIADDHLILNPFKFWNQIRKNLPKQEIKIYGPSPTSGTREEIDKLIMEYSCKKNKKLYNALTIEDKSCNQIRRDGHFAELGKNENLIIKKVIQAPKAIGITGYNFYIYNKEIVKPLTIDNIRPNLRNFTNMKYPLVRPLYIYAKNYPATNTKNAVKKFLSRLTSKFMIGYNGYLQTKGLIPLPDKEINKLYLKINENFTS